MAQHHTVEQGEHLPAIAQKYGFGSYKTIWEHDQNASLRETRKNPNILQPGDTIFIPDKEAKTVEIDGGKSFRFRVKMDKVKLRLLVAELYGNPLANAECEVRVNGKTETVVTGEDGVLEIKVPATTKDAELIVRDKQSTLDGIFIPLQVGHLDPVEEKTGQIARLNNLGYFAGPADKIEEKLLVSAIEEFQCDHGLKVDGVCGPKTQGKLVELHGC
jgi:hypothetical protein